MTDGWIKLYRKITEWEWYTVPSMAHLFIHLLLTANQKEKRWKGMTIKRGQLVTSAASLAEQTGMSKRTILRNLLKLVDSGEIEKAAQKKCSIITILKFDQYQSVTFVTDNVTDNVTQHKNIRKKERKNTSSSPSYAREGNSERRFYDALRGSTEMMAAMHDAFGLTTDAYWTMLASFDRECEAKGKQHADMVDYKRHFFDWTRRHVEINGKEGNKNKGKGYGNDDSNGNSTNGNGRGGRDAEIRRDVDNMLAKYGLTSKDVGI